MNITIYTTQTCTYCNLAKKILKEYNLNFKEINVENNLSIFKELINKTHHKTVPQVFINDVFIGGYTDLCDFLKKNN